MKKTTLILIFTTITFWSFGQKTLPDTLINSEYIDVVRIKDSIYSVGKYSSMLERVDEITFSNGKKVYSYSGYKPMLSENKEFILNINYKETLYSYEQFQNTTLDVYNYKGELVKSYPYYIEDKYIAKLFSYYVLDNGNLLIHCSSLDNDIRRLYLYNNGSVVKILDQEFGENTVGKNGIWSIGYYFIKIPELILVNVKYRMGSKLLLYDYSGKLINGYNIESHSLCMIQKIEYDKETDNILINYGLIEARKGVVTYKIIYDMKNNKFIEDEK